MTQLQLPLSNVQLELLKLYATDLSNEDMMDLKNTLSQFYAQKSIQLANKIWDEKGYTDDDMDNFLNNLS